MSKHTTLEATPEKRIFWSIISDYGLKTGICELVDNAIDLWQRNNAAHPLGVSIEADSSLQIITIKDNAGGVPEKDLSKLVTPGGSKNDPLSKSIGIFGVGSKRAGVALGQTFRVKTRHKKSKTFLIEVNDDWLKNESWEIDAFEVQEISPGSTEVEISRLRSPISNNDINELSSHISSVYGRFISRGLDLSLNGVSIEATEFNHWAYPPDALPRVLEQKIDLEGYGSLDVTVEAGLILDRDPEGANYGVYFYCNDRLIVRDWKERAVGYFVSTEAGVPHPDASLARVIVSLDGAARAMPWSSSKDGINTSHEVFKSIQKQIVTLSSFYTKASRRWKNDWSEKVFKFSDGDIQDVEFDDEAPAKLRLPPAPKGSKHYSTAIKELNSRLTKSKPWTLGLIESMAASRWLATQNFSTKNRMALILLDSNLEIAFKEFIVNDPKLFPRSKYNDSEIKKLFKIRSNVISAVAPHIDLTEEEIIKIESFYLKRNKIIHERATVGITDDEISSYRSLVEDLLRRLFSVRFPAS